MRNAHCPPQAEKLRYYKQGSLQQALSISDFRMGIREAMDAFVVGQQWPLSWVSCNEGNEERASLRYYEQISL